MSIAICELTEESLVISDSMLRISGGKSRLPALVGDSVTLYCASGQLIGPNRATCQDNGDWEPDLSDVMCKQVSSSGKCAINLKDGKMCMCMCTCVCNNYACELYMILIGRCDPPLTPINGYFLTTTNASVTFVCDNETQLLHFEMATCNERGVWEPDPRDYCTSNITESDSESKGTIYTYGKIHNNIIIIILRCLNLFLPQHDIITFWELIFMNTVIQNFRKIKWNACWWYTWELVCYCCYCHSRYFGNLHSA